MFGVVKNLNGLRYLYIFYASYNVNNLGINYLSCTDSTIKLWELIMFCLLCSWIISTWYFKHSLCLKHLPQHSHVYAFLKNLHGFHMLKAFVTKITFVIFYLLMNCFDMSFQMTFFLKLITQPSQLKPLHELLYPDLLS